MFVFSILNYLILITLAQMALPWWSAVLIAFFFALELAPKFKLKKGLLVAFLFPFFQWVALSFYFDHQANQKISFVLADIFSFPAPTIFLLTGLMIAIPSALAFVSGYLIRTGGRY